jgi:hypothetical protein
VAPEHLLTILMVSVPAAVSRRWRRKPRDAQICYAGLLCRPLFLQAFSQFAIADRSPIGLRGDPSGIAAAR